MSSKAFVSRATALSAPLLGAVLLGAGALLAPRPVAAQGWSPGWYGRGPAFFEEAEPALPPRAVVYRLRDRGFTEITRPLFDGRGYRLEATDPAGQRVRLFVDAGDGAVIGRQRLDPYYPSHRPVRTAPGYGWTEEDAGPRGRAAERLIPPADIPNVAPRPSAARPPRPDAAPPVDANALGVNPDARGRAEAPPRRTAKLTPPSKPAAPRTTPVAPAPKLTAPENAGRETNGSDTGGKDAAIKDLPAKPSPDAPAPVLEGSSTDGTVKGGAPKEAPAGATATGDAPVKADAAKDASSDAAANPVPALRPVPAANPTTAAVAPSKQTAPEPVRAAEPAVATPAAGQPPAAETVAQAPKTVATAPNWQTPPASEPARKVRVIGGATVVPRGESAPQSGN